MEAIKTKGVSKNGKMTIQLPPQFDEQELEVIVLSNVEYNKGHLLVQNEKDHQEKIVKRLSIIGSAKNPNASVDDYDVYDQ